MSSRALTRRALRPRPTKSEPVVSDSSESSGTTEDEGDDVNYVEENEQNAQRNGIGKDECDFDKPKKRASRSSKTKQQQQRSSSKENKRKESKEIKSDFQQKISPRKQQETKVHLYCTTCIIIAVVAILCYITVRTNSTQVVSPKDRESAFLSELEVLQKVFPSQNNRFWSVVGAAPMSHLMSTHAPERPVVVLLVGQPGTDTTISCIANHLGRLYTKALGGPAHKIEPLPVNGSDFAGFDADEAKLILDTSFRNGFDNACKAAIVHHFDKLPSCSVLLFHSYCENSNAPYKNVAIILTLEVEEPVAKDTPPKEIDSLVDRHVTKLWRQCPELQKGKIEAMLSRVANNVVLVTEEQGMIKCPAKHTIK